MFSVCHWQMLMSLSHTKLFLCLLIGSILISLKRFHVGHWLYLVMKWHFMFNDLSQSNKSGCKMFDQFEPKSQVTKLAYFFSTFFDEVSGTTEKHAA